MDEIIDEPGLRPLEETGATRAGSDRGLANRASDLAGRAVEALGRMRTSSAVVAIAITMVVGWLWIYAAGGEDHVPPHWFYIPILMAAVRFGIPGTLIAAVISGVAAGPLLPADVEVGARQLLSDEVVRGVWFLVIGTLMALILARLKESLSREADLARREAELATHKAAVIATVSHEFRTPLSVLLGSSKMLVAAGPRPEVEQALLEGIFSSARRLNDLVTTVLAVSEGPLSLKEPVAEPASLAEIVSMVVTRTDPRDAPRLHVDVGAMFVWSDPGVLESLLRQLVDNALRFSPQDAPVDVTARLRPEGGVEIVIADRGPGIDPRFLLHAFEPFTQLDASLTRTSAGLGVGLFVARRLAEYLGVGLQLQARPAGGTEAVVTVQAAGEGSGHIPARADRAAETRRSGRTG